MRVKPMLSALSSVKVVYSVYVHPHKVMKHFCACQGKNLDINEIEFKGNVLIAAHHLFSRIISPGKKKVFFLHSLFFHFSAQTSSRIFTNNLFASM